MNTEAPELDTSPEADLAPQVPAPEPTLEDTVKQAVEAQKARAGGDEPEPAKATAKAPASPGERPRGPDGKFVPSIDRPAPGAIKPTPSGDPSPPSAQIAPDVGGGEKPEAPAHRPPPGWSPASKVAFDALPENVKADIAKREQEINQGFAKLAELKPVEKYAQMARESGTTLDRALENYVGIEQTLRRDVFAGVEQILRNVGVNPISFAQAYLQRSQGGPSAGQPPTAPPARQQAAIDPNAIVRQATEAVRAEYEARAVQSEIERFAADPKNRFFENVKPKMAQLVQVGAATTIQDAYDQACWADPEIRKLLMASPQVDPRVAAAQQARSAARATVGAPSPGMKVSRPGVPPGASVEDTVRAAVESQRAARA